MKWKIGNVKIDNQVVLAPMAGICDSAFRRIIKSMGCGLIETEMVSDKAIMYENTRTQEMLYMTDAERPISQQIFGAEAKSFKIAAEYIENTMKPDIIDINMGCPVPKVAVRSQAGSALLKNPPKIGEIVETVVESVNVPVTAKIRSGWDESCINALEVAGIVEDAGASAITVHPRTREQRYGESADWSIIKDVKESLSIPVIGNGDIWSCYDARKMIDEEVTLDEKIEMIKRHAELLSEIRPEKVAMHKMRTHTAYYLKGQWRSSEIKPKIFKMNTKEELFDLLEEYIELVS